MPTHVCTKEYARTIVCVCVCGFEREREGDKRERERERERDREREREREREIMREITKNCVQRPPARPLKVRPGSR